MLMKARHIHKDTQGDPTRAFIPEKKLEEKQEQVDN